MRFLAAIAAVGILSMMDLTTAALLREQTGREPVAITQTVSALDESAATAALIRERFAAHPKQRRFWCESLAQRLAAVCTRRAGKSDGGVHEWLAKAITLSGWRGVYINTTRLEAKKIVWRNDLGAGWLDLLGKFGQIDPTQRGLVWRIGGVTAEANLTDLVINFSNGSQIALFGADDEKAIDKLLGQAKDEVWIDEAQKFPHLRALVLRVVGPLLKDKGGRLRLTGVPAEDCTGYFYDVTPEAESGDTPLPGWEVHRWSVTDNPYFGRVVVEAAPSEGDAQDSTFYVDDNRGVRRGPYQDSTLAEAAAVTIRWDNTAGEALIENGWTGAEPEFIREWLGKWEKSGANYVYPVHAVPPHILVYAPQRLRDNPLNATHARWLDHELALRDLPRRPGRGRGYDWMTSIGADFGYAQTPFALTAWAFTFERPDIFEIFSWKQHKVLPDDQRQYIELLWNVLPNIVSMTGDPAGQKAADLEAWRTRFSLPIDDADKSAKNTWQTLMAGDIRKGNVHYREGSPLLHESKHLIYLPTRPGKTRKDDEFRRLSDGTVPGNDCCDGGLYAYKSCQHHLFRDKPKDERDEGQRQSDAYEEEMRRESEYRKRVEIDNDMGYGEYEQW